MLLAKISASDSVTAVKRASDDLPEFEPGGTGAELGSASASVGNISVNPSGKDDAFGFGMAIPRDLGENRFVELIQLVFRALNMRHTLSPQVLRPERLRRFADEFCSSIKKRRCGFAARSVLASLRASLRLARTNRRKPRANAFGNAKAVRAEKRIRSRLRGF